MLQLWQISALALVAGMLSPATGVGVRVLLPHLVQEDALERANALASTSLQFASLVGPVLAGILVTRVGGAYALMMDAVSFLLMGLLVFSLPSGSRSGPTSAPAMKTNWLGGFALLLRTKELRYAKEGEGIPKNGERADTLFSALLIALLMPTLSEQKAALEGHRNG